MPEGAAAGSTPRGWNLRGAGLGPRNRGVTVLRERGALCVPVGDVHGDRGAGILHRVRALRHQQEDGPAGFQQGLRRVQGHQLLSLATAYG